MGDFVGEIVIIPYSDYRTSSKHRYKRYRSPEWYKKRTLLKEMRYLEWRRTADPFEIAVDDGIKQMIRNLSIDLYGDGIDNDK